MSNKKTVNKGGNVLQLPTAKTSAKDSIEPPEGWLANCKYGLLRRDATTAGVLVRIEDVANWLSEKLPRKEVIYQIFFELITYNGSDADFLYVVNSQTFAKSLITNGKANRNTDSWWQFLPSIDHNSIAEEMARSIAEAWERVWPGLSNPELDHEWRMQRTIARNKERNAMHRANMDGQDYLGECWPEDEFLLNQLMALAIPVITAHALWGYGRVAEPQTMHSIAEDAPKFVVSDAFKALCLERSKSGGEWSEAQRTVLRGEEKILNELHGRNGVRAFLAKQLGSQSVQAIGKQIRKKPEKTVATTKVVSGRKVAT